MPSPPVRLEYLIRGERKEEEGWEVEQMKIPNSIFSANLSSSLSLPSLLRSSPPQSEREIRNCISIPPSLPSLFASSPLRLFGGGSAEAARNFTPEKQPDGGQETAIAVLVGLSSTIPEKVGEFSHQERRKKGTEHPLAYLMLQPDGGTAILKHLQNLHLQ